MLGVFGIANWHYGWTDWQTALIFGGALAACLYVTQSNSVMAKLFIPAILATAGYMKGHHDGVAAENVRRVAEIAALKKSVQDETTKETIRQDAVNEEAQELAKTMLEEYKAQKLREQQEFDKANQEATNDPQADRPALSIDAVQRLNRLRGK